MPPITFSARHAAPSDAPAAASQPQTGCWFADVCGSGDVDNFVRFAFIALEQ